MNHLPLLSYNETTFAAVGQYPGVALIRFHAPWCAACSNNSPAFESAVSTLPPAVLAGDVNVLQAPVLADKYQVRGLPNTLIFYHGREIARLYGPHTAAEYIAAVEQALNAQRIKMLDTGEHTVQ